MRIFIVGTDLPGRTFCAPGGAPLDNVHVGVQIRTEPEHLVRGDATDARWEVEIDTAIATVVRVHGRWMVAARLVCRQRHDRGTKCSTLRWNSEMAAS